MVCLPPQAAFSGRPADIEEEGEGGDDGKLSAGEAGSGLVGLEADVGQGQGRHDTQQEGAEAKPKDGAAAEV